MTRHLQLVGVRPEKRDEYLALHAAVWPQVEETITAAHLENYSIFIHGDLLIAYFEYTGDDFDADLASIAAHPVTQEWWKHTDPCQRALPEAAAGAIWTDATEVWHLP